MSVWGWVLMTYKTALIKEPNHLFWIITLLSKGTAAACLRSNLICLSKNTGIDTPAQWNHGKEWRLTGEGSWGWVWLTAVSYFWTWCLLLCGGAGCFVRHISCTTKFLFTSRPWWSNRHEWDFNRDAVSWTFLYLWRADQLYCEFPLL